MTARDRPVGPDTEGIGAALAMAGGAFEAAGRLASETLSGLHRPSPQVVVLAASPRAVPAAEALAALARPLSPVPVDLVEDVGLPAYAGPGTLVVVSALGSLEARRCRDLADEAARRGADVVVTGEAGAVGGVEVAEGAPAASKGPAALAPLVEVLPALLAIAGWAGVVDGATALLADGAAGLSGAAASLAQPEARLHEAVARRIGRTMPLFEGARGVGAVAARSWRRSWNLLVKAPAFATAQPRAAFEEVSGFGQNGDVTRQLLTLVCLRTRLDAPEDRARSGLLAELAGEALAEMIEVEAPADSAVGALVHLEWLGVATAYARARQEGLDPGPLPAAEDVERRLVPARPDEGLLA